ncbi:MAG: ABC transporter permease [Candidatus Didemnitutus sp.]|nr:ABC transporter permease [Candidatus Didemnitutus sp.]
MNFRRRLRTLFRRRNAEAEMAEEMRFHLEQRAADYVADGLSPTDAHLAAQRKFGNTAALQEHARDTFGWGALERFGKDVVHAARQLVRAPGFSLLAIVTLGLGIGANTSMFSLVNGILLKPLPYQRVDQLERIYRSTAQNSEGNLSPADFLALRKAQSSYGTVIAYTPASASLSEPGRPAELAYSARTTADLFSVLGVTPQLGRTFRPEEDQPGRDHVVILSQRTWRGRFLSAPDIIGRTVRIDGVPHEIIGVMPESFNDWRFLGVMDFFRPLALTPAEAADRQGTRLRVIGRRDASLTPAESAGFIASFGERLAREFPEANHGSSWRTVSLQKDAAGSSGLIVLPMLVSLSAAVLLIACSNLANFLLARTMARAREFAVRAALGASRLQLLRPLFAEALLLSLVGGGVAIFVAHWFRDWAAQRSTRDNGEQVIFTVDWHVMGWAFAASLFTALVFSVGPALFALRLDLNETLKSGGRGTTGSRGHQRFRQFLIVAQFTLAMVLLAGAAQFLVGVDDAQNRRAGWESAPLATGSMLLPAGQYGDDAKLTAFHRLTLERLGALPGVEAVSLSAATPFLDWNDVRKLIVEGQPLPAPGQEPAAMFNAVSPQYLATYGTRLVSGRTFDSRDTANSPRVYLVSQSTARALFGESDPIGRRIALAGRGAPAWGEIVGVVSDIQSADPEPNTVTLRVYPALAQEPTRAVVIAVRAAGVAPSGLLDSIRTTMADLDSDLPIDQLTTADASIARTFYEMRFLRDMLTAFGVLGLGLASLGVYGVITRTTAQRAGEFAIRLALGASPRDITRLVLGAGVRQALLGSLLGLLGAYAVTSALSSAFRGVHANSPLILAATTLILIAVALVACWLPSRRASRIDAMAALRAD